MRKYFIFLFFFPMLALAIDLKNGVAVNEENKEQLWETSIPYAIARQGQRVIDSNGTIVSFLDIDDSIFSLSSSLMLVKTKKTNRNSEGSWLLVWLDQTTIENQVISRYQEVGIDYRDMELMVKNPLGCLRDVPLRYDDIDGVGTAELVIFAGNDMVVFSPGLKKTVFQARLRIDDWFTLEETNQQFEDHTYYAGSARRPQYESAANSDWLMHGEPLPGYRGYAKLYFGDFDADGAFDIVVWRKLYESRVNSDSVKGFIKKGDLLVHYKLVNGEYKKQNTDQAIIKGWLTAKQLTWSKGYPNKSECAGHEGQLIPEMHDPLLNDPDVLQ